MLRSTASRRILSAAVSRLGSTAPPISRRLSATASPHQTPPQTPTEQQQPPSSEAAAGSSARGFEGVREANQRRSTGSRVGGSYEEEQARVLRASLPHVLRVGWTESAMISGARDAGVSPSIVGSFPRKEAALVEFFMDDCLQRLVDTIDTGLELQNLILSERLSKLVQIRLEMQIPYISKWPQALSIQAHPTNLPTSFKQRALLVDEIWHAAGDQSSDIDWYAKRTVLGGIYSASEVYMLTDHSPEFRDTWTFLGHRIRDAFDLQKNVQEAAYLAEAIGAGMGNSMQGFMKKVFQR